MMRPWHRAVVLLAALAAVGAVDATAQTRHVTAATGRVVERFVDAAKHHTPGDADASVHTLLDLSPGDRDELNAAMPLFLAGFGGKGAAQGTADEMHIFDLGAQARHPTVNAFAERAAMLLGDAAIVGALTPQQNAGDRRDAAPPALAGRPANALLSPERFVVEGDGEFVGEQSGDWKWLLARVLLRAELPRVDTPEVAEWFHATSAFMMERRLFGEAANHLQLAAALAPTDARILFDRGCYAEMNGLPGSQALLSDEDLAAMRQADTQGTLVGLARLSVTARRVGVRPSEIENADAERLFRAALDVDPDYVEARVRLARLLELRGLHTDAAAELDRALKSPNRADPAVTFFAHLFAGRVDRELGKLDDAASHFQAALALFPHAQSALLGASQVAVLRADVSGTLAPVHQLDGRTADADLRTDPWWNYDIGSGRNAEVLLAEMWADARRQ